MLQSLHRACYNGSSLPSPVPLQPGPPVPDKPRANPEAEVSVHQHMHRLLDAVDSVTAQMSICKQAMLSYSLYLKEIQCRNSNWSR